MVTSSKILTVTYGTFSCTLEGFDDPFTTLQMVAEYFRKLAAQDRYFGGVPQVPDTDTLKRIAEENNPHGIDAEIGDNGIILRQSDATAAPEPTPMWHEDEVAAMVEATETSESPVEDTARDAEVEIVKEDPVAIPTPPETGPETAPAAKEIAATAAPAMTFFTSRRTARPAGVSDPVIAAAAVASVTTPAARQPAAQITVEETLAAIRQNVEQAEDVIADARPENTAPAHPPALPQQGATADVPLLLDEGVAVTPAPDMNSGEGHRPAAAIVQATPDSTLSQEQEDELARDLEAALAPEPVSEPAMEPAAVVRAAPETPKIPATPSAAVVEEGAQDDLRDEGAEARRKRIAAAFGAQVAADDQALERLLETTQSKMDRPEQIRRMNALDQLKAAVAATEAEQQLNHNTAPLTNIADLDEDAADLAAYRDDLRRAKSKARTGLRATTAAPSVTQSPLILVSEQRIDTYAAEGLESDTPRAPLEVAKTDGNLALKPDFEATTIQPDASGEIQGIPADAFSAATSFSDFAERIGAFDLIDLLEASAAYISIIENKPRFSRAQVMSKIAKLNHGDAFSKEAGLRAFGKLLREGKILRVQDGQFGISKASRFSIASRYND